MKNRDFDEGNFYSLKFKISTLLYKNANSSLFVPHCGKYGYNLLQILTSYIRSQKLGIKVARIKGKCSEDDIFCFCNIGGVLLMNRSSALVL